MIQWEPHPEIEGCVFIALYNNYRAIIFRDEIGSPFKAQLGGQVIAMYQTPLQAMEGMNKYLRSLKPGRACLT